MMVNIKDLFLRRAKPAPLPTAAELDAAFLAKDFATAIPLTRRLAESGDAAAHYRLGEVFEYGLGVLQDFAQALDHYERAAEAGYADAWAKLGDFYLAGRGARASDAPGSSANRLLDMLSVRPDHDKALHWNRKAAEAGLASGQAHLALQYIYGLGVEADRREAEGLLLTAADKGSVIAQRCLGMLYAGGEGEPAQYDLAEHWFRAASDAGDAAACLALSLLIINGHATSGTHQDAHRLLTKAADEGHVEAMLYLGSLYRDGLGTPRDLSAAETWFRRASVRGNRNATLSLGFLLTEAMEPRDYISGASVFREAAEQGDPVGQYVLGKLYLAGLGVPQDDGKAFGWIAQAADQDMVQAIEALAALHAGGRGVERDAARAIALFERAAAEGSVDAPYHIAMLMLEAGNDTPQVATLLEDAAARGSHAACIQLGIISAGREDYAAAARQYHKATELGSADGLFNLAFLRLRGLDPAPADTRSGIALLEVAADEGHGPSIWALHNLYADGDYVTRDDAKARHWHERAMALAGTPTDPPDAQPEPESLLQ